MHSYEIPEAFWHPTSGGCIKKFFVHLTLSEKKVKSLDQKIVQSQESKVKTLDRKLFSQRLFKI